MKFIRFFALILVLSVCCSFFVSATQEETQPTDAQNEPAVLAEGMLSDFEIRAKAAMLIELKSNTVVYEYEKDLKLYPASLTKIMTCMLAIENGNLEDVLTVSSTALENLNPSGSTAGLLEGEKLTLNELLYCIMVSSANEGCNVIAEYIAEDISSFVAMMNQKAAELGMKSTHFANTHGLHDDAHYTTAYDLSLLARWAWQNEQFRECATTTSHTVPKTNKSDERTLSSTNHLTNSSSKYYYSRASGIKTGFTTPAGGCLISTATNGDLEFMSIVLGCSPQTAENGDMGDERFVETKKLFEYGFNNLAYVQILSEAKMVDMQEVLYADGRSTVVIRASRNTSVLLPKSFNAADIVSNVEYDELPLQAPLSEGQRVGTVTAYYNGKAIASCDAVTLEAVARSKSEYVAAEAKKAVDHAKSWISEYWFLFVPIILITVLLIALLILRAVNARRAKKRAEMRRRNAERRRRRNG